MAYNGSGTFLINTAGQPVVAGTVISSTTFNSLTADLATGLSTVITKDGQTTVTANIPMASFKFTGLGVGSAAGDSANLSQVQSTVTKLLASVSGADTVTATASPTLAAYAAGQMFYFVAAGDNTTSVTLNIDALGAKAVTRDGSVALAAADIKSGEVVVVVYDGTRFQVVSQLNSAGDARFANVSIASSLYVGGVSTFVGNAGFSANVSITSALSVGGVATITGAASIQGLTVGRGAGAVATNTVVGASALAANTTGSNNSGFGQGALQLNTTGAQNTAIGLATIQFNTTGSNNLGVGYQALNANTTASNNSAVGTQAAFTNTTGASFVALGTEALYSNTTGSFNVALGRQALYSNTTASNNTAVGYQAGYTNITGTQNTYSGYWAGYLTTGSTNSFFGYGAGSSVTTGGKNTIIGGYNGNQGSLDIRTSSNNIVLSDGDGNPRARWDSGGNCFLTMGTGAGTNAVKINSSTKEVTYDTSSARYKDNIRDSKYGLADVMQLRSAMFEYKKEKRTDVGFIAEEVVHIIPELVAIDNEGRPDAVSYDRMVSVLVKAIQELKAEFDAYKASHP